LDESRILGRVTKRVAESVDRGVQPVIEVHERIGRPQLLAQQFSGDERPWMIQEILQQIVRLPP
jgi:hypothetical protein